MNIQYLFSSPRGDLQADERTLSRPFLVTPHENHPFLTLRDYFEGIGRFLLSNKAHPLLQALSAVWERPVELEEIKRILIRSEKHGALYHLASAEIQTLKSRAKFAVSAAVTEASRAWLNQEFYLIRSLNETHGFCYLPDVYCKGEVLARPGKHTETMVMALSEWFEGFHEWHLSRSGERGQHMVVWDMESGCRPASHKEHDAIYREATKILTLYYDVQNYRHIYPWHHAAGDFLLRTVDGEIDARLTTVRKYEPIMVFVEKGKMTPWTALMFFFLTMTLQMRLDKLDGLGDVVWADQACLEPILAGFLLGLKEKESAGHYDLGNPENWVALWKAFSRDELARLLQCLLPLFRNAPPSDIATIRNHLPDHAEELYLTIQNFRPESPQQAS
jgi:hypothetical protein